MEQVESRTLLSATPQLAFTHVPDVGVAGTPLSLTVSVSGTNGTTPSAAHPVPVTVSVLTAPAGATVPPSVTVPDVAGTVTASGLTFTTAGLYTLAAQAPGFADAPPVQVYVEPGAFGGLAVEPWTAGAGDRLHAGQALPPIDVELTDAYGNPVGDVGVNAPDITASVAGVTLGGTTALKATDGTVSFSDLTLPVAGTYDLTFADGSLTATMAVTIVPPLIPSATVTAGSAVGKVTVDAAISLPNWQAGPHPAATVKVTIINLDNLDATVDDGAESGGRGGDGSFGPIYPIRGTAPIVHGTATFRAGALRTLGRYAVEVTDSHGDSDWSDFTVVPGPPVRIAFDGSPAVVSGGTMTVEVYAVDRLGIHTGAAGETVTLSLVAPNSRTASPTISGNLTAVPDSNGYAEFTGLSLSVTKLERVQFRATMGDLRPVLSPPFWWSPIDRPGWEQ